jgi:hypothetical protein
VAPVEERSKLTQIERTNQQVAATARKSDKLKTFEL